MRGLGAGLIINCREEPEWGAIANQHQAAGFHGSSKSVALATTPGNMESSSHQRT